EEIWPTLKKLSKASARTRVAVAYLGIGASKQLDWKKNDVLVVAMSLENVKCGQVNPFEIQTLFDLGVKIYTLQGLHAKIYVFDNDVVIGSANISFRSENVLTESALLTDDRKVIKESRQFIDRYSTERVEQDY